MAASGPSTALVPKAAAPGDLRGFEDLEGLLAVTGCAADGEAEAEGEERAPELREQVKALTPEEHEGLWRRVLGVAGEYLKAERLLPGTGGEVEEAACQAAGRVVHAVAVLLATFAEEALDASRDPNLPQAFAEVAAQCQDMLLSIPNGHTQSLIARALERVCTDSFESREDFYGGVLMFLIGKCLAPKMASADVTRLHKVRDLIGELDWEHESIESLKMQLMRCAASPNFVRSQHGPDMLCLFYTVHPGFTAEVHSTVKNQVIYCRPAVLKAYATGFFKAWRSSEGGTKNQIEHCVQDWVTLAICSARKSADKARAMLEEFHRHHLEAPVNELLCRLYGPLLWRSLKVANWQVRENTARLLQYVFPMLPGDLGVADREQELAKQVRLLRETLEDPSEPVRRVGCSAVCVILKLYWDMLPPAEIAELLAVLMNKCAHDKKAPMVRAAVAEGFGWILKNALSHPTMAAVLPQMSELLNDRSPIVRAAFIDLLTAVSECKGVSVCNMVSNDDLLLRLASEHTEGQAERLQKGIHGAKKGANAEMRASPDLVAKHLARLMAPSLFQHDLEQQVARCHHLMQHYPLALLALLTHLKDVTPVADRVKLAAALFGLGLRDAGAGQSAKSFATMLRVVGVLLEGATEPVKRGKRKGAAPSVKFPKELERFVYQHIREEDFMGLLQASGEGEAARLREDLLYAISPLDPARLPNTAELVRHELTLACRGGGGDAARCAPQRLTAFMRTAVRWGILDTALEPAWERLLAAATRLGQRQPAAEDTAGAVSVVEAVLRDSDIRGNILPLRAETLKQVVRNLCTALCGAFSAGLAETCRGAGPEPLLLGPAAEAWPRILGLIVRLALHLEHRLPVPVVAAAKAVEGPTDEGKATAADGEGEDAVAEAASTSAQAALPASSFADPVLDELGEALTCQQATQVLEALEAAAAKKASGSAPPAKKRAKGATMPSDVNMVLQVYERLLEALNAAHFLAVLKRGASASKDATTTPVLTRALEEHLWRWACAADALRPQEEGLRSSQIWTLLGRLLQQVAHSDMPTPNVIEALLRLLHRTTDEVPKDNADLRAVLQALFGRLEFEPQLLQLVAGITGLGGAGAAEQGAGAAGEDATPRRIEVHPRVQAVVTELVPSFRNLRAKLLPQEAEMPAAASGLPSSPGQDRRRILASPTPQKAARVQEAFAAAPSDIDGESATESPGRRSLGDQSIGRRSFSVRSRSPPPPLPDVTGEVEADELARSCVSDVTYQSLCSELGSSSFVNVD